MDTSALSVRPLHLRRAGVSCHRDRGMSNTVQEENSFLPGRVWKQNKKKIIYANLRGKMRKNTSIIRKTHWIKFLKKLESRPEQWLTNKPIPL